VFKLTIFYLACAGHVTEQTQSPDVHLWDSSSRVEQEAPFSFPASKAVEKLKQAIIAIEKEESLRKKERLGILEKYIPDYKNQPENLPTNTIVFRNSFFGDIESGQYLILTTSSEVSMPKAAPHLTEYLYDTCSALSEFGLVHTNLAHNKFRIQIYQGRKGATQALLELKMRLNNMDLCNPFKPKLDWLSELFEEHTASSPYSQTFARPKPNFSQELFCAELVLSFDSEIRLRSSNRGKY